MNKTMKASTVKVTMTSLFRDGGDRPAKPHNSTECLRRRLCRQLIVAVGSATPLDVGGVKVSTAANVGQRSPPIDGEIQPDGYSAAASNRRFSSLSGDRRRYQRNVSRPTIAPSRRSRGTHNFEAADFHQLISQVLGCISKGRYRRIVVSCNMLQQD